MQIEHRGAFFTSALLLLGLCASQAHGGTLITSNLPAGTTIVNVDARADGSAAFSQPNPPQAFWYQPTPSAPSVTFQPGTYTFRVIDRTDAAAEFPGLTPSQLSQVYTAWTFNSPWILNYMAFRSTAITNPSESQLFDGALPPPPFLATSGAQVAYNDVKAQGYLDKIRAAPPGRAGISPSDYVDSWTFTAPTTMLFVVPDNVLGDNTGGVSIVVSVQVPEPSAAYLVTASLAAVASWLRRM